LELNSDAVSLGAEMPERVAILEAFVIGDGARAEATVRAHLVVAQNRVRSP